MLSNTAGSGPIHRLQAVFWDMDGTLVDTEPCWIAAEYELVESFGGTWTPEQAHALVGQALTHSATVLQEAGVDMGVREIIDHLIARVVEAVREEMPWRPGARDLLAQLQTAGVRSALVTMSEKPLAEAVVAASGSIDTASAPTATPVAQVRRGGCIGCSSVRRARGGRAHRNRGHRQPLVLYLPPPRAGNVGGPR